jgi:hypothetical protein
VPTSLLIDKTSRIVYSTFHGRVTDEDLLSQIEAIRKHPDFSPDLREVVDFSGVVAFAASANTVTRIASQESLYHRNARRIIVASEDLVFGLARMFQMRGEDKRPNLEVVRTLDEAKRLLGIDA